MSIDLAGLTAKDLDSLIVQARKRKTTLNKRKPLATVRAKLAAAAAAEGYSVAELFGGAAPRAAAKTAKTATKKAATKKVRKLGKVAPKYRNPADPKEMWTGRGKHPRWMAALLKKGKKVEEFLIKK